MRPGEDPPPRLITYADIAAARGVQVGTVRQWHHRGRLPPPDYRIGNSPAWLEENVREFMDP